MITTAQLRDWSEGKWIAAGGGPELIRELAIDSRNISNPGHALFIALHTERRDGHEFIRDAWQKGVHLFLVDRYVDPEKYPGASILLVPDTLQALHHIITAYRDRFTIPVIGITGSNGKTVVKEWLGQMLQGTYNLVRNPQSYNSQIGVPLSVWQMDTGHELAVFEAGISRPGEMERLRPMIRPDIGVFTNIGEAHSEGFRSRKQKISEKLILFRSAAHLVYCSDYEELEECIGDFVQQIRDEGDSAPKCFRWSAKKDAELRIESVQAAAGGTEITALYRENRYTVQIPFTDAASVENAIHCWCVLLLLGVGSGQIRTAMTALQPVAMRLELRQGISDCVVINDSYNSDLTSLNVALDYLQQQTGHNSRTVILSDILQAGRDEESLYREVRAALLRYGVTRFIGIGPALYRHRALFRGHKSLRIKFCKSTRDFLKQMHRISFSREAILLKGARVFAFEQISALLEEDVHQAVLSIDLSALVHNLNVFRRRLSPDVKIMAMVKAFAYGSGSSEVAGMLQYHGVDYLAVAYTDEGIALRKAGISLPVMVMSPDAGSFDRMVAWKLEPELYSFRSLREFMNVAAALQLRDYPVHIKLDTGMHRLGFAESDLAQLTDQLRENRNISIASIFSHLAGSDEAALDNFTAEQAERFRRMSSYLSDSLQVHPLRHLANSAGATRHPECRFDMVRLGIGLYGISADPELRGELLQVGTLKTTVAQVRTIPAGDTVGYGRRGKAASEMRVATICIGYADGYPRSMGNGKGYVLIRGEKAPVVGNVCMDMCMVDVTAVPGTEEGDEVLVFGPQLSPVLLAEWADTIPYEIMTGISRRIRRVYVKDS